jgi:phytoene dehydrogenase-like protein
MSATLATTRANLDAALGPGAGADWARFMARAARIWQAVRQPFLESPLDGPATLLRLSTRVKDLATVAPLRTLHGLGRTYLPYAMSGCACCWTGTQRTRAPTRVAPRQRW